MPVGSAHPCVGGVSGEVAVIHPGFGLGRRARPDICADIWFGIDHAAELDILVGTKRVRFWLLPPKVVARRTLIPGAYAVLIVVIISKTAPRPSDYRRFNLFQRLSHIGSDPVLRRNIRVVSDSYAFVSAATKMLDKMTKHHRPDLSDRGVGMDGDRGLPRHPSYLSRPCGLCLSSNDGGV